MIRANIGDISNFLNAGGMDSPLKNITVSGDGDQVKLRGTLHKIISLPVELVRTIAAVPDNRIQMHVTKLRVLKIPLKGLLGGFRARSICTSRCAIELRIRTKYCAGREFETAYREAKKSKPLCKPNKRLFLAN